MKTTIQIDVVSDVVCPWCYVGKKNMEKAIAQSPQYDFQIRWFPFQLNPFLPEEGVNHHQYLAEKFGSEEVVKQAYDRLVSVGKQVGIHFAFDKIEKAINTFHLHRVLMAVGDTGKQTLVKSLFLQAFFEQGLDLSQDAIVKEILGKAGFAAEEISQLMDKEYFAAFTEATLQNVQQQNIRGVPLFIINQKYGISGAQPVEVFLQTFEQVAPAQQTDLVCDIDAANC